MIDKDLQVRIWVKKEKKKIKNKENKEIGFLSLPKIFSRKSFFLM